MRAHISSVHEISMACVAGIMILLYKITRQTNFEQNASPNSIAIYFTDSILFETMSEVLRLIDYPFRFAELVFCRLLRMLVQVRNRERITVRQIMSER